MTDDMPHIPDDEQECVDFDWFGVDEAGHIGHFTTAGFKRLPRSVAADAEGLETMTAYFMAAAQTGTHRLRDDRDGIARQFDDDRKRIWYYKSFVEMADRGLYSFDIATYVTPGLAYFKVADPVRPLTVRELPDDIQRIISRTLLKGITLARTSEVPYASTLEF